jgi:hypothetical protein
MRLCMFHPGDHPLERGWVGRIDGDRVVHLAAQTLSSFFTGGGSAREHGVYAFEDVRLLAPVLHPPAVRIFDDRRSFAFSNPSAVVGTDAEVARREGTLSVVPRLAAIVGGNGALAGYTTLADWRDATRAAPKDRDFALGLGPTVVTADAIAANGLGALVRVAGAIALTGAFVDFDWEEARAYASDGTALRPGDVVAGPGLGRVEVAAGDRVEIDVEEVGVLAASVV